jgi:uncharacterized protein YeaO (DUF488 family)
MPEVRVKRIYDPAADDDGTRVLVDRVWPRGVSKDDARFDRWDKDVAPSSELRKWYAHDPAKFEEFARRYRAELAGSAALTELRQVRGRLTLLTATRDVEHSQAAVLAAVLSG